jgi:thiopeptide-type bacteriocin biosynthesis protein
VDYTFHLRVRVFSRNMAQAMFPVLSSLEQNIGFFYENRLLEDFYIAPYEQETSLYKEHVRLAELLFYSDSDAVLSLIDKYGKSLGNDQLLLNLLVSGINDIFRLFDIPEDRTICIIDALSRNFIAEFGDSKDLRQRLKERCRQLLKSIGPQGMDDATREIFSTRHAGMHRQLQAYTKDTPLESTFVEYLAGRLIHLYVNRLCPADPRKHELILYYTLNKYYIGRQQQKLPVLKF